MHQSNQNTSINTININNKSAASITMEIDVTFGKKVCKLSQLKVIKVSAKQQGFFEIGIFFPSFPLDSVFGLH